MFENSKEVILSLFKVLSNRDILITLEIVSQSFFQNNDIWWEQYDFSFTSTLYPPVICPIYMLPIRGLKIDTLPICDCSRYPHVIKKKKKPKL